MTQDRETWVAIENDFPDHPKIRQVGMAGGWVYLRAICYADRFRTNGFIPELVAMDFVHYNQEVHNPGDLLACLVEANLWEEVPGGYQIHDYLQYQRNGHAIKERREEIHRARVEAGRRGGKASAKQRAAKGKQTEAKGNLEVEVELNPPTPLEAKNSASKGSGGKPDPKRTNLGDSLEGATQATITSTLNKSGCTHARCAQLERCYYE